ncbi:MAG: hypothetical protein Q9178_001665 [Gyalolechia marmorata]
MSSAFGNRHPYFNTVHLAHSSPPGQKAGCDRLLTIEHSDSNTTFLKIIDTDTDEMIAQAKWNIYNSVVPNEADLDCDFWASEEDKELDSEYVPSPSFRFYATSFSQSPAPPRLPKEEQELYEKLQASSTGAFSTPKPTVVINQAATPEHSRSSRPQINQSPHSTPPPSSEPQSGPLEEISAKVEATGKGEELHPDVRRGAKLDFEGERNPKTGEVGGPKNDPLRWGGDWSYNGRVTDF